MCPCMCACLFCVCDVKLEASLPNDAPMISRVVTVKKFVVSFFYVVQCVCVFNLCGVCFCLRVFLSVCLSVPVCVVWVKDVCVVLVF